MEQCATRIFEDSRRTYGSRRLSRELKKAGFDAGRHQTRSVMAKSLCAQALQMACWRRKPAAGLPHHSDRGSQYASAEYRGHLEAMGMRRA